jgi:hypothetical protein
MPQAVGAEIDSWCTKCRMDLQHVVVAIVSGQPKRVECQTCHTQHNYRKPKGVKDPVSTETEEAVPTSKRKAPRLTKAQVEYNTEYEARVEGRALSEFTKYSVKHEFQVNDLVAHKKFGNGSVAERLDDNKISVMFKDGLKTLIHARE